MRRSLRNLAIPALLATMFIVAGCNIFGGSSTSLTGKNWQWSASTTTAPASQSVVPNPEDYTIEFKSDGTFAAKADCNQVAGSYTTADGGALTITAGPSTLVACPDDSLADLYMAGLAATQSYAITDGQLVLTTSDGTMTFD